MAVMTRTVEQCVYSRNMNIAFWLFRKCCGGIYYHGDESAPLVARNFFTTGIEIKFSGRLL